MPQADRDYIENKYHRTDMPYDGLRRFDYHGYELDPSTGMTDGEIKAELDRLVHDLETQPRHIIKARAVEYVLDHTRIDVNEHDYFPHMYSWGRIIDKYTIDVWYAEAKRYTSEKLSSDILEAFPKTGLALFSLDFDHTVPDYDSMMELGFQGILDRAEKSYEKLKADAILTEKQEIFFRAVEIEYKAIIRFVDRLYKYALTKSFDKAPAISRALKQIRDGAPTNTYEALLMNYIYFMVSESIEHYQVRSLGYGMDGTIYPFYQNDLASNTFTKEELGRFIAYFLMQFAGIDNYWGQPMYIAGTNPDGTTKVNELTYYVLDIYDQLGIYNPKIQFKLHPSTPKDLVLKALDMIRHGSNSIVFVNEETVVKALMRQGATYEKAVDSVIKGCYEYVTKADALCISCNIFNALKPIELVFNRGIDVKTGIKVGIDTGDVTEFKSFEEFYNAYRAQFVHAVQRMLECLAVFEPYVNSVNPATLYSATIPKCARTLTDATDGGIRNVSSMWLNGLGTGVDALMAVYELVFEQKITTMAELKTALDANWEGYERLRLKALKCKHKYGNGDRMADAYANTIHNLYSAQFSALKNCHGGNYEYELHSARTFIEQGRLTWATPDGRRAGDETSKNASPTPGMDRNGVTALIRSATNMDLSVCDSGGCLDIMLHPSAVQSEDGLEAFYGILTTYAKNGGASVHFNVFNAETLIDAQKHPENYKNLQVRVCGWNVLWNNMVKEEQDAYITRALNIQ